MNLKEAFRYQNFLSSLLQKARMDIMNEDHCLVITKRHLINEANPEAENKEETVEHPKEFIPNDIVLEFMKWVVGERSKLTRAISIAKAGAVIDIDAAVETNKARQLACDAIKCMLKYKSSKTTENGKGYKFNAEGNQAPYYYTIEVETKEAFDREKAKTLMYEIITESDKVSSEIDAALINTIVDYTPVYSVNADFDDVISNFAQS